MMSVCGHYIDTRKSLNYSAPNTFVMQQIQQNVNLLKVLSLHYLLDFIHFSTHKMFNILPLGNLLNEQVKRLFMK
jgi:hypothetical protein